MIHAQPEKPCPEVLVLGAAAIDMVARIPGMPDRDGFVMADSFNLFPGGSGANIATSLARLGRRAGFLGVLGDDETGKTLMDDFLACGVDTRGILVQQNARSAGCFIAVTPQGERMMIGLGGVALIENPGGINPAWLTACKALLISDAFMDVACHSASAVRAGGGKVFLNPGGWMVASGLDGLKPLLAGADILILNRWEAARLTGCDRLEDALNVLQHTGPGIIIITRGIEGVLLSIFNQVTPIPSIPVRGILDTTGAGDVFIGALICGHLEGMDWEAAARLGLAAAAIKIEHLGARSGQPSREQVDEVLARH